MMGQSFKKKLISPKYMAVPVFFTLLVTTSYAQSSNTIGIYPPNTKPYGISYEDHIKNYWKFVIKFPNKSNPWTDETGKMCRNGREGLLILRYFTYQQVEVVILKEFARYLQA